MQICLKCIQHLLKTSFERKHGIAVLPFQSIVTYTVADFFFVCLKIISGR